MCPAPGRRVHSNLAPTSGVLQHDVLADCSLAPFRRLDSLDALGCRLPSPSFLINLVGAAVYSWVAKRAWFNSRETLPVGHKLLAHPHSFVCIDGRGAVSHRARGKGDRGYRTAHHQVSGRLAVISVVSGTVFSLSPAPRLLQRPCSEALCCLSCSARLSPDDGDRSDHGDRRRRYAYSAVALTVLLGSLSGISISKLLVGGIVPGLILSVSSLPILSLR